jgi:hypothetical protein
MELRLPDSHFRALGLRVDAAQIPKVIARMEEWIARREGCRFVPVTGMHGVTEAQQDGKVKEILSGGGDRVGEGGYRVAEHAESGAMDVRTPRAIERAGADRSGRGV